MVYFFLLFLYNELFITFIIRRENYFFLKRLLRQLIFERGSQHTLRQFTLRSCYGVATSENHGLVLCLKLVQRCVRKPENLMQSMSVSFIKLLLKSIHYVVNSETSRQNFLWPFVTNSFYKRQAGSCTAHHVSLLASAANNFRNKFYAELWQLLTSWYRFNYLPSFFTILPFKKL